MEFEMKVSFLGLGVMGYPMAGYLVKAGHEVCVYNRTAEKPQSGFSNMVEQVQVLRQKPQKVRKLCSPVLAMTTTSARS